MEAQPYTALAWAAGLAPQSFRTIPRLYDRLARQISRRLGFEDLNAEDTENNERIQEPTITHTNFIDPMPIDESLVPLIRQISASLFHAGTRPLSMINPYLQRVRTITTSWAFDLKTTLRAWNTNRKAQAVAQEIVFQRQAGIALRFKREFVNDWLYNVQARHRAWRHEMEELDKAMAGVISNHAVRRAN